MEPPPLAPPSTVTTTAAMSLHPSQPLTTTVTTTLTAIDSTESSDDKNTAAAAMSNKLRLMCSYGGHIMPRPHDKSLCYIGGDTRIVVADRSTNLSSFSTKLSNTLFNGRPFTLKYQLPNEDLDSLISVTTDEDLDNMIEEYDRTNGNLVAAASNSNNQKQSRLRLFLFPVKPESTQSMIGPILESTVKSEDWFLSALNNGCGGVLNRGFSDSASVNCLLGLDDGNVGGGVGVTNNDNNSTVNVNNNNNNNNNNNVELGGKEAADIGLMKNAKVSNQDLQSVPGSPMLENNNSSFGSTNSTPSLANLPPIRVHADEANRVLSQQQEQKVLSGGGGMEEQFAQMNIAAVTGGGGSGGLGQKQLPQLQMEDGNFMLMSSPPPMPTTIVSGVPVNAANLMMQGGGGGGYVDRIISDDERSDHGVQMGYRMAPAPVQAPPQFQPQQKTSAGHGGSGGGGNFDVASPDSVSSCEKLVFSLNFDIHRNNIGSTSDGSLSNPLSRHNQNPGMYQDMPQIVQANSGVNRVPVNNPLEQQNINLSDPNARVHFQQQMQDSGYILQTQPQPQFEQQQSPQQQYIQAGGGQYIYHHHTGPAPGSNYYPVHPPQQQQHHQVDPQHFPTVYYMPARQQPQQVYTMPPVQQQSGPVRPQTPPSPNVTAVYNQMRNPPTPEMAYRTAAGPGGAPQLVQLSSNQQQYVGYSPQPPAATGNYAYEFADPNRSQMYYTQPLAPTMVSQYQTMATSGGVVMPEASDSAKQQQQIRTSQPL
ncbi:hypothetical protein ACFE04_030847 [Oxalis oulophora]